MKILLIDRDGVLNPYLLDDYVRDPKGWYWQAKSLDALKHLKLKGILPVVITNQSCINRHIITWQVNNEIQNKIKTDIVRHHGGIIDFFVCPHIEEDQCFCRKPKPGNLLKAMEVYSSDPLSTYFVGDSPSDVQAARNAGITPIALLTGNPKMEPFLKENTDVRSYTNLWEAVLELFP